MRQMASRPNSYKLTTTHSSYALRTYLSSLGQQVTSTSNGNIPLSRAFMKEKDQTDCKPTEGSRLLPTQGKNMFKNRRVSP